MSYEFILTERLDGCAVVTLNRPEKLNALSFPLMSELDEALTGYEADEAIKAVIVPAWIRTSPSGLVTDHFSNRFSMQRFLRPTAAATSRC